MRNSDDDQHQAEGRDAFAEKLGCFTAHVLGCKEGRKLEHPFRHHQASQRSNDLENDKKSPVCT